MPLSKFLIKNTLPPKGIIKELQKRPPHKGPIVSFLLKAQPLPENQAPQGDREYVASQGEVPEGKQAYTGARGRVFYISNPRGQVDEGGGTGQGGQAQENYDPYDDANNDWEPEIYINTHDLQSYDPETQSNLLRRMDGYKKMFPKRLMNGFSLSLGKSKEPDALGEYRPLKDTINITPGVIHFMHETGVTKLLLKRNSTLVDEFDGKLDVLDLVFTHELGHRLLYHSNTALGDWLDHVRNPENNFYGVTDYSLQDEDEHFAEAFLYYVYAPGTLQFLDPPAYDFIDKLPDMRPFKRENVIAQYELKDSIEKAAGEMTRDSGSWWIDGVKFSNLPSEERKLIHQMHQAEELSKPTPGQMKVKEYNENNTG